jgi:proteasome lid subunit RPN8/RPN11
MVNSNETGRLAAERRISMPRDLNKLMEDLQRSREVFVTSDGQVEDASEAAENQRRELDEAGRSKPRTLMKPERFATTRDGDLVRVDANVLEAMHSEAARHQGETGGIVVGPDERTITVLIPSGPKAKQTAVSYELDVEHIQPLLAAAEDRGLRFLGIWHSHPRGCDELSEPDREAIRRILRDRDWAASRLIMPLTVRQASGFSTEFFVADAAEPAARPARVVVFARTRILCPRHRSSLEPEAPVPLVTTSAGLDRIERDLQELRCAGWRPSLHQDEAGALVVVAEKGGERILLCLPAEYPFDPPDVIVQTGGRPQRVRRRDLAELTHWSSSCSLVTTAEQATRTKSRIPAKRRTRRPPLHARLAAFVEPLFR